MLSIIICFHTRLQWIHHSVGIFSRCKLSVDYKAAHDVYCQLQSAMLQETEIETWTANQEFLSYIEVAPRISNRDVT